MSRATSPRFSSGIRAFYKPAKRSSEGGRSGKVVLYMDPSPDVLALLREILRHAGPSQITTNNLHDARLLSTATRPGLVIQGPNISAEWMRSIHDMIGATPQVTLKTGYETLDAGEASELLLRLVQEKLSA